MTGSNDADRERGMDAGGATGGTDPAGDVGDVDLGETDEPGSGAGGRIPSATTGGATRVTGAGISTAGGATGGTTSAGRTSGVGDTGTGDHLTGGLLDQEPGGAPVVRGIDGDAAGDAASADDTGMARPAGA